MSEFDLSQFHFLRPWWFLALIPLLYLAWRFLRHRHARSQWERTVDPALLDALLEQDRSIANRWLGPALAGALTLSVLALAGPTWERLPQPVEQRSDALVIVLDLTMSMLAEDVQPSRAVRARHKVADILRARTEGHTGLVVYSGDAHVVTPMTDDSATIENLLPHLSPDIMPLPGHNPAMGVQLARQLMENAGARQGRIVLITSGVRDIDSVARHAARNFPVSVLGVGTRDGAPIPLDQPDQSRRMLRDEGGNVVFTRLDATTLNELARRSHGRFTEMTSGDADIQLLLETALPLTPESLRVEREFDAWVDRGYLMLVLLLPLALLGFRRGALVCLCLITVAPVPVEASTWASLWTNSDRRALEALEQGEPERAAQLFTRPEWRGIAHFRSGNFESAEMAFAGEDSARGHYNRGNALAWQGRYEEAIAAYERTLELDPAHDDAAFNRDLLQDALEQEAETQGGDGAPQPDRDPHSQGQNGTASDPMPGSAAPDDGGSDGDSGLGEALAALIAELERKRDGDSALGDRDQLQREEEWALQQWLRRVPDDPGGLLRRKFHQETNRRLREGELQRRQDTTW
jgi:Ca-activated chloride channel homolog